ncbi:hypothetical protein [Paenibacillus jamilae]|uniref:hypothetical protein n=1 Tax=Paenibacillus jamilae TaxID=114136 RepID=UPI001428B924|nr:hypothetical protein [Paenibacillus jamilae]
MRISPFLFVVVGLVTLAEHPSGVEDGAKLKEKERGRLFLCSGDGIHQPNIDCESVFPKPRVLSALTLSGIRWPHSHRPGICHQDQTWDALIGVFSLFYSIIRILYQKSRGRRLGIEPLMLVDASDLQDT